MPQTPFADVLSYLRRVCAIQEARDQPDGQLLERFVVQRDEAAFGALVHRHGPMVLGVCQRVLGDLHAAEDSFQATFLVLVRRAASLARHKPVGGWLHAVAQRVALKARAQTAARRIKERRVDIMPRAEPLDELTWQELRGVLDEEIARLPEKYRTAIVLCYFEGRSHDKAAKELGVPKRSLTSRVERGRELLRQRLVRRGITLSVGALATALGEKALAAPVAAMLTIKTVKAGMSVAVGKAVAAGWISAQAVVLAEEAAAGMLGINGKLVVMVLTLGLAVGGAGVAGYGVLAGKEQPAKAEQAQTPPPKAYKDGRAKKATAIAKEVQSEPLPQGAVARLGVARFSDVGRPLGLAFARDGTALVAGSWDGTITVWDPRTKQLIKEWESQAGPVRALAMSPDGTTLATAGTAPGIRLWRRADGELLKIVEVPKNVPSGDYYRDDDAIDLLAFSPDGKRLLSANWRAVRLYDPSNGKQVYARANPSWRDGRGWPGFSADGATLFIAFRDNPEKGPAREPCVIAIDTQTGKEMSRLPLPAESIPERFMSSDQFILCGSGQRLFHLTSTLQDPEKRMVWVTDIASGRRRKILESEPDDWHFFTGYAFSPDERFLALVQPNQEIVMIELATGGIRCRFRQPENGKASLDFSPDGRSLACGSVDRTILLWDLTGRMGDGKIGPARLSAKELDRLWSELDGVDGATITRAIWEFVAGAGDSVPFLAKQLQPARPPDPKRVTDLLGELASDSFQVRTKGTRELEELHDAVEPFLRKKLAEPVPLEVRRRLEQLLEKIDSWWAKQIRQIRAVEVLERVDDPKARQILEELSLGQGSFRLGKEAQAAVRRLERKIPD